MGVGRSPSPLHVGIVSKTCFQMPLASPLLLFLCSLGPAGHWPPSPAQLKHLWGVLGKGLACSSTPPLLISWAGEAGEPEGGEASWQAVQGARFQR